MAMGYGGCAGVGSAVLRGVDGAREREEGPAELELPTLNKPGRTRHASSATPVVRRRLA